VNIRMPLLSLAAFVALTSLVLHGVHQWGRLSWNASMMRFSLAQTSLTVLWSVLGVIAWVGFAPWPACCGWSVPC
jgi:hypothetical protein